MSEVLTAPGRARHRLSWLAGDAGGLAIAAGALAWSMFTTALAGSDGGGHVAAFFLSIAGAYAGGRLLTRVDAAAVPLVLIAVGLAVIVVATPDRVFTSAPRAGPFQFSSITGAFFMQCAFGAAALLFDHRTPLKVVGVAAAVVFASVPFATHTRTSVALLALVPLAWVVRRVAGNRAAIDACGAVFALSLVAMVAVAASYSGADAYDRREPRAGIDRFIDATVTLRRVEFQHDALTIMVDRPLVGIGPGRFDEVSAAVARDPDEPWAHNDFLQHGAESGVPGLAFLVALVTWAFVRIHGGIRRRSLSVLAAVALASLTVHASVEYVLQRPAVPAVAAAIVGCAVRRHTPADGPSRWLV